MSIGAIEARKRHTIEALAELQAFHRDRLSPVNRLNFDLYKYDLEISRDGDAFPTERMPIGPRSGVQIELPSLPAQTPFHSERDYEMYLARLFAIPRLIGQVIALMKEGVRTGWVPSAISLSKVPDQLAAESNGDPGKSEFFEPFTRFPDAVSAPARDGFARRDEMRSRAPSDPPTESSPRTSARSTSRRAARKSAPGRCRAGTRTTATACARTRRRTSRPPPCTRSESARSRGSDPRWKA